MSERSEGQQERKRGEGSLEAPTRHPIRWKEPGFYDEAALNAELARVFDVCHGCRRCVNLCNAFPTLFDLVDNSPTLEVDGVDKAHYPKVVEQCYLCDLCYMTKCPYVPPHPWNIDFPHLMLRAKAHSHRAGRTRTRDRILGATDVVGRIGTIPVVAALANAATRSRPVRRLMDKALGIHPDAPLPVFHSRTLRKQERWRVGPAAAPAVETNGKVVLFATCYGNRHEPRIGEDLIAVFEHNGVPVRLAEDEVCCGMPRLEQGDLEAVERQARRNVAALLPWVEDGWDVVATVPSCVLMFKKELPLLFPGDGPIEQVGARFFDPCEYLALRHKAGRLKTDFKHALGTIAYHVPCHQRVQNIGPKTAEVLALVPGTSIERIERCSGHDGTYGVKRETHEIAVKIGRPVVSRMAGADHCTSDCPLAASHLEHEYKRQKAGGPSGDIPVSHPLSLLRFAYGI